MSAAPKESVPTPPRPNKGRFALGNPGGPGNPFGRQVAVLRQAVLDAITPEKISAITDAMTDRAQQGNVGAAKLVFQYSLGKPAAAVEPDRVEIEDYRLRTESAVPTHVWAPMLQHLQAKNINEIAVVSESLLQSRILEPMEQALRGEVPTKLSRKGRKALRLALRRQRRENGPSPNGSNGAEAKRLLEGGRRASKAPAGSGRTG